MKRVLRKPKKNAKRFRYFAYGSNMLRNRLENRVGKVIKVCTAYLRNYKLDFSCGNMGVSFANVTPESGSRVFGVVYKLTEDQLRMLDRHELFYQRETLKVNGFDTIVYTGLPFHTEDLGYNPGPTNYYTDILKRGYEENLYPQGVEDLEKILEPYNDLIPNYYGHYY